MSAELAREWHPGATADHPATQAVERKTLLIGRSVLPAGHF